MRFLYRLAVVLFLGVFIISFAHPAYAKEENTEEKDKKEPKKEPAEKPFQEVIKDYKVIEGLFTLYLKEDEAKVYMSIKPDQLDKTFLCTMTRTSADGSFYDSGALGGNFAFKLKRVGKKIQFLDINVRYRADSTSTLYQAIDRGITNSIFGVTKIESQPDSTTGAFLVDPSTFFLQDVSNVSYYLGKERKTEFNFDRDNSYFGVLKSFPQNTEIDAVLHFKTSKPSKAVTIPNSYSMFHTYHYSLSTLPESDYIPRLADDRLGHFLTPYQDYTNLDSESPYVWYINRWKLEKADPDSPHSPPKEPIVFWLEKTIPEEYVESVKEGVLFWNRVFEKIGFKDAMVAKLMPDTATWDPADVRYNTIRWIVYPGNTYAVGPSRTNPFTGQIYDADIRICVDFIRYMFTFSEEVLGPISFGGEQDNLPENSSFEMSNFDNYGRELAREGAFALAVLNTRNDFVDKDSLTREYVKSYLRELVAHEVGHTLGLRHNYKASTIYTREQLQDREFTSRNGLFGSIMEYNPPNVAAEGETQGEFFTSVPGPYDYWVMEYAYKPIKASTPEEELPELQKIASRASQPELAYGTDYDTYGNSMRGIDPYCNTFDLGNDPIEYYRKEIDITRELWSKLEGKFDKPGTRYQKLLRVFNQGWRAFSSSARVVPKFIGGINHYRDHIGDPGGRIPFKPVPASKQREALQFLRDYLFAADAFSLPEHLLNKLQPERLPDFSGSVVEMKRIDYPLHDRVISIQRIALNQLYDPVALSRLQDIELRYKPEEDKFTMADMFQGIRKAIWNEIVTAKNINSFRRSLQRVHLEKITELVISNSSNSPEDARTLARVDLKVLEGAIKKALLSQGLDIYTRGHLDESLARIDAALKAGIERKISNSKVSAG